MFIDNFSYRNGRINFCEESTNSLFIFTTPSHLVVSSPEEEQLIVDNDSHGADALFSLAPHCASPCTAHNKTVFVVPLWVESSSNTIAMLAGMSLGVGVGADVTGSIDRVVDDDDVVVVGVDSMSLLSPGSLPLAGARPARPVSLLSRNFVLWFLRHPPTDLVHLVVGSAEPRFVVVVVVIVVVFVGVVPSLPLCTIHKGIGLVDRSVVLFLSSMIGTQRRSALHYPVGGSPHS